MGVYPEGLFFMVGRYGYAGVGEEHGDESNAVVAQASRLLGMDLTEMYDNDSVGMEGRILRCLNKWPVHAIFIKSVLAS